MKSLSIEEVDHVSGGKAVEAGVFTVGLGTSAAAGLALGPVGVGVAVATYCVVFGITSALQ